MARPGDDDAERSDPEARATVPGVGARGGAGGPADRPPDVGSGDTWALDEGQAPPPPRPPDDERYERAGLLGKGGMGRVWLANDRRLDRPVALKEAVRAGRSAARLVREARVTAGLDHPGIVAVHDAGLTAEGLPFYTMPVVRGRTLEAVLADTRGMEARLALVRAFLQVCQAVAYAHSQGVIHRDLKPANVLIGPFGESRVADWGIAARIDEPDTPGGGAPEDDALTYDGEVMGTPAYISPEQARGELADRRSDVWGLGAVLYELLAGETPLRGSSSAERLAAARRGEVVPIETAAPEAPRELVAIVARALQAEPAERYPDAGALAADVEAWVDGRRVAAHTYTPRELLQRFVRTYRLPLLVAGAGLVVLTAAQAWSNLHLRAQRDRAEAAEADTRAALAAADTGLAQALLGQAAAAMEAGAIGRAEVLAAASLARVESPGARGLLAGAAVASRPTRLGARPLPTCLESALVGLDRVLCATEAEVVLWEQGVTRWRVPAVRASLEVYGDDAWIIEGERATRRSLGDGAVLDTYVARPGVNGARRYLYPPGREEGERLLLSCGEVRVAGVAASPRVSRVAVLCRDGRVGSAALGGLPVPTLVGPRFDTSQVHHTAIAGHTLLVATVKGELVRVDLRDGRGATVSPPRANGLRGLRVSPDGSLFVELPERGDVVVRRVSDLGEVARVPATTVRDAWVDGQGLAVAERDRVSRWALPTTVSVHHIPNEGGLSTLAVSADGRWLASGNSRREVVVRALPSGAVAARHDAGVGTVKHLVALEEGFAWVGTGAPPNDDGRLWRIDSPTATPREALPADTVAAWAAQGFATVVAPVLTARRLARLRGGWLVLPYERGVLSADDGGAARRATGCAEGDWVDVSVGEHGRAAWLLDAGGLLARFEDGACTIAASRGAGAVAALGDGWVSAEGDELVAHAGDGGVRWRAEHPGAAGPTDLATSADGRWLAAAGLDHRARIYDAHTGRPVALLEGATERVSAVVFGADRVYTASWDGSLRIWDLASLDTPAEALVARSREAWAVDVQELLNW